MPPVDFIVVSGAAVTDDFPAVEGLTTWAAVGRLVLDGAAADAGRVCVDHGVVVAGAAWARSQVDEPLGAADGAAANAVVCLGDVLYCCGGHALAALDLSPVPTVLVWAALERRRTTARAAGFVVSAGMAASVGFIGGALSLIHI